MVKSVFSALAARCVGSLARVAGTALLCKAAQQALRSNLRRKDTQAGFSLVELMVVLVIIGLISTIVLINVLPSQDRAMIDKAKADIAVLEQAVEAYRIDTFVFPTNEDGLGALLQAPQGLERADRYRQGGYIKRLPEDPWGRPYQFAVPGEDQAFDIWSFGADGVAGGEGNDADIGNWQ